MLCGSCVEGSDNWDPYDDYSGYARLSGLQNNNQPYYNPLTGEITRWVFDGDPVSQSDWIDNIQEDKRILISVSSNDLEPEQSIKFTIAIGIGADQSNLESVNSLRSVLNAAESAWQNNFSDISYVDRPILEMDCCDGSFGSIEFNSLDIGQVQSQGFSYFNTGNEILNMNFSSDNSNLQISPSSISINSGSQGFIEFSYSANDITSFSEHNVPDDFSTIQSAIESATETSFSWNLTLTDNDEHSNINSNGSVSYSGGILSMYHKELTMSN